MDILIIEDEQRAANQLQRLLNAVGFEHTLLDILDTIESSVEWFQKEQMPDLVFMDIQLADGLSFEIFKQVEVTAPIIFTTAFDQYAIRAFKVNSVDYLLKPIQKQDLELALDQFSKRSSKGPIEQKMVQQLLQSMQMKETRKGILVKDGSGFTQLKISDLLYVYSEDSINFGVTNLKRYIIEETMDQLFNSLNQDQFFRINRGQIISKAALEKFEPYFNQRIKLVVSNPRDQEFIVSRQKTKSFKEWLNS